MAILLKPISLSSETLNIYKPKSKKSHFIKKISNSCSPKPSFESQKRIISEFNPKIPLEQAVTPPSSWYTDNGYYEFEVDRVFYQGWQAVGYAEQTKDPHDFFTGRLGNVQYVVCRDGNGKLRAFHNVCRHHASILAVGTGQKSCFVCPYHGWTYGLDGLLLNATRISGIQNFDVNVFCDNYLDGGYHVAYAHKGLASGLKLDSYVTTLYEKVSTQICEGGSPDNSDAFDRLGSKAIYAFVYPNFMINRYGPWMDTNLVLPLGPSKCQVIFDYFLEDSLKDDLAFIERSLEESERVQMEDIVLCEGVQKGLESPAYCTGRYAPAVEKAMYHFHGVLYDNLST